MIYLFIICILILFVWGIFQRQKIKALKTENIKLKQIIEFNNKSIENYKASRVAVRDVLDNLAISQKVMALLSEGIEKNEVIKRLNIPAKKFEFILKLDKLQKEKINDE